MFVCLVLSFDGFGSDALLVFPCLLSRPRFFRGLKRKIKDWLLFARLLRRIYHKGLKEGPLKFKFFLGPLLIFGFSLAPALLAYSLCLNHNIIKSLSCELGLISCLTTRKIRNLGNINGLLFNMLYGMLVFPKS